MLLARRPRPALLALVLLAGVVVAAPTHGDAQSSTTVSVAETPSNSRDLFGTPQIAAGTAGNPVVAYTRTRPGLTPALRVMRCGDASCAGTSESLVEVNVGATPDNLLLVSGLVLTPSDHPVISVTEWEVRDGSGLAKHRIVQCGDPNCSSDAITVHQVFNGSRLLASELLLSADGTLTQVVSEGLNAQIVVCPMGSCEPSVRTVRGLPGLVLGPAAALDSSDNLVVAYSSIDPEPVVGPVSADTLVPDPIDLVRCSDSTCTTLSDPITVLQGEPGEADLFLNGIDLALDSSDAPLVAFAGNRLLICNDPECSGDDDPIVETEPVDTLGVFTQPVREGLVGPQLVLTDDGTISLITQFENGGLRFLSCTTRTCENTSNNRVDTGELSLAKNDHFATTLDRNGQALITWTRFGNELVSQLVVAHCGNLRCGAEVTCDGYTPTVLLAEGQLPTPQRDVIIGTEADDIIAGGDGDDVICGLGGDDQIWGQLGNDDIFGGEGNDRLRGGAGGDLLLGEGGADNIAGGTGDDDILGGDGDDTSIRGGTGDDRVWGDAGSEALINGNGGRDNVYGGEGDDRVIGGPRPDNVYGGAGNDVVKGNSGADKLSGWTGDDELFGGPGIDMLNGGEGVDFCNGGNSTSKGAGEFDTAEECETEAAIP